MLVTRIAARWLGGQMSGAVGAITAALLLTGGAWAHGGGLDNLGCHSDTEAGTYHCHQGELAGRSFASEDAARRALGDAGPDGGDGEPVSYDRALYGGWRDRDGDCQDTRTKVLLQEAEGRVELGPEGCEIVRGRWAGFYTGATHTNPSALHIDHLVPLKEAHVSGAASWPRARKRAYATTLEDPNVLIAVEAGANMAKGAQGPADWLPERNRCAYVQRWAAVKTAWELTIDPRERRAIERVRETHC
jgi:hypothetical protein